MARSLPKVCPFLVTLDLKLKWSVWVRSLSLAVPVREETRLSFPASDTVGVKLKFLFRLRRTVRNFKALNAHPFYVQ